MEFKSLFFKPCTYSVTFALDSPEILDCLSKMSWVRGCFSGEHWYPLKLVYRILLKALVRQYPNNQVLSVILKQRVLFLGYGRIPFWCAFTPQILRAWILCCWSIRWAHAWKRLGARAKRWNQGSPSSINFIMQMFIVETASPWTEFGSKVLVEKQTPVKCNFCMSRMCEVQRSY